VRYFLTGRQPDVSSILLVESGSRAIAERVANTLRRGYGPNVRIDLVSCYSMLPEGFDADTRIYRVSDYRSGDARRKLFRELAANRYSAMGIICSGEPLMTKWKGALAYRVPAKIFIINENADYFWLDYAHLKQAQRLVLLRAGLAGAGAVRTLTRAISFPFVLFYLLLYASVVHARRAMRKG